MPLFVKSPVQVLFQSSFPSSPVRVFKALWPSARFCFLSASGLGSSHCFFSLSEARFLSVTSFRRDTWDRCKCSLYFGCRLHAVAEGWYVDYVQLRLKFFILVKPSCTFLGLVCQFFIGCCGSRMKFNSLLPSFERQLLAFWFGVCVWWWFLLLLNLVCVPSPIINRAERTCILKTKKTHSSSVFNPDHFSSLIYAQSRWDALAHCIFCAQIFNKFVWYGLKTSCITCLLCEEMWRWIS